MGSVDKRAHIYAANYASWHHAALFNEKAAHVKAVVLATIAPHNKAGDLSRSIQIRVRIVGGGVRDLVVESTDPQWPWIEYGHWTVPNEDGEKKWVPGIKVFNRAFNILKKGG